MSVLSLTAAKAHLNITASTHDAELTAMIEACEAAIAQPCGPLEATVVTERVAGGVALVLNRLPVISLTSVTPVGGTALTVGDLYLDPAGFVEYATSDSCFPGRRYDVVYQAGRATCPPDLLLAVKELLRHLWDTQRGPTRRPGSAAAEGYSNTLPGAAHSLPFRVVELITPHIQPGFA